MTGLDVEEAAVAGRDSRVTVVGAGIGGLTAALLPVRAGAPARPVEPAVRSGPPRRPRHRPTLLNPRRPLARRQAAAAQQEDPHAPRASILALASEPVPTPNGGNSDER
jgi:hypothetical protein